MDSICEKCSSLANCEISNIKHTCNYKYLPNKTKVCINKCSNCLCSHECIIQHNPGVELICIKNKTIRTHNKNKNVSYKKNKVYKFIAIYSKDDIILYDPIEKDIITFDFAVELTDWFTPTIFYNKKKNSH